MTFKIVVAAAATVLAVASANATHLDEERARFRRDIEAGRAELLLRTDTPSTADAQRVLGTALALHKARGMGRLRESIASGLVQIGGPGATVQTTYGPIVGLAGAQANQYLGVPFASPPVGALRWRAPQPPQPWTTPLNTTWWKPACMQSEWYWGILGLGISEDCLYLNIYTPAANVTPPSGGFGVGVFFYGGSYEFGGASFPLYDGITPVSLVENTIIVTLNYRLNAFGFLAGDLLQQESPDGSVGNYGFQDQRAAIQFVKANIAAFGGNPNKITIFGESAGGASVANHLVSPRSLGLFSGAIIESGSFSDWTAQPPNISFTRLPQVAKNLGCQGASDVLACMRAANATALMGAQHDITSGQLTWSPTEDGVEVLADPRTLLAAGKIASVPIMLGINHDEGTLFNSAPDALNASEYVAALAAELGEPLAEIVAAEYPATYAESPWWSISVVLRDSQMLCPARSTATLLNSPLRVNGTKPVFAYFYTQILELIDIVDIFRPLRCFHGSELVSVFDLQILLWGAGEQSMADTFVGYWTTFMNTGSPNGPSLPTWDPFTGNATGQDLFAEISTTPAGVNVTMITGLQASECAFWAAHPIPESVIWG